MSNLNSIFDTLRGWPEGSALEMSFRPDPVPASLAEGIIVKTENRQLSSAIVLKMVDDSLLAAPTLTSAAADVGKAYEVATRLLTAASVLKMVDDSLLVAPTLTSADADIGKAYEIAARQLDDAIVLKMVDDSLKAAPTLTAGAGDTGKAYEIAGRQLADAAVLKIKDDAQVTAPGGPAAGEAHEVAGTGGLWSGFTIGDIVEWSGAAWVLVVAHSGGNPPDGTRAVVIDSGAAGSFVGGEEEVWACSSGTWTTADTPLTTELITLDAAAGLYHGEIWEYTGTHAAGAWGLSTDAWRTFDDGDIVEWSSIAWARILANTGGAPADTTRAVVVDSSPGGSFVGHEEKAMVITTGTWAAADIPATTQLITLVGVGSIYENQIWEYTGAYAAGAWGLSTDAWRTYDDGDLVEWSGAAWARILAAVGGAPPNATRAVVVASGAAGSFAGAEEEVWAIAAGTWTTADTPADGNRVLIDGTGSAYETDIFQYDGAHPAGSWELATGGWTAFTVGDIVEWSGTAWVLVLNDSGGDPPDDTRVVVVSTGAAGSFAGSEEKVMTVSSGTWTVADTPVDENRILIDGSGSVYEDLYFEYAGTHAAGAWAQAIKQEVTPLIVSTLTSGAFASAVKPDAWLIIQGNDQWDASYVDKVTCLKMNSGCVYKIAHTSANTLVAGTKVYSNAGVLAAATTQWPVGEVIYSNGTAGASGFIHVATF
jgi:hypothetical protein